MAENSLSDLITYIGTDVYGREMREHIKEAFQILANSSLTAEERAKIAASISYVPQALTDDQKQTARNNIGAAKAGETGRGWTEEQIGLFEQFKSQLATVFERIGYKDNSAEGPGQQAAGVAIAKLEALIESLRTVPRELESITVALKNGVSPRNGRTIQLSELEVTGHYSDGTSSAIGSGYELVSPSDGVWTYPTTTVSVRYSPEGHPFVSAPISVDLATLSVLSVIPVSLEVTLGTTFEQLAGELTVEAVYDDLSRDPLVYGSTYSMIGVLSEGLNNIDIQGEEEYEGLDPRSINVTVTSVTPVLDRLDVTPLTLTVDEGTELADLAGLLTVNAFYDNETFVTLTYGTGYKLTGSLIAGRSNRVAVSGLGNYAGLSSVNVDVTVEAAPVETTATATADATGTTSINQFTVTLDKKLNTVRKIEVRGTKGVAGTTILNADFEKQNGNWVCTDFELTNGLTLAKVSSVVFRSGYTLTVGEASGKTTVSVPSLHYVSTTGAEANTLYGSAGNPYTFTVYGTI